MSLRSSLRQQGIFSFAKLTPPLSLSATFLRKALPRERTELDCVAPSAL